MGSIVQVQDWQGDAMEAQVAAPEEEDGSAVAQPEEEAGLE